MINALRACFIANCAYIAFYICHLNGIDVNAVYLIVGGAAIISSIMIIKI